MVLVTAFLSDRSSDRFVGCVDDESLHKSNNPPLHAEGIEACWLEADRKMAPTVIPAHAGIQPSRSTTWMPAGVYPEQRSRRAGMTN